MTRGTTTIIIGISDWNSLVTMVIYCEEAGQKVNYNMKLM